MASLFLGKTQNTALQFVRYICVGGVAAAVDTGVLYFLYASLGIHHLAAAAVGFAAGLIVNYLISVAWVFESSGKTSEELLLFALIGIGGLAWTELILWAAVDVAQAPVLVGKGVALCLVLVWNFGMRKKFVFASR